MAPRPCRRAAGLLAFVLAACACGGGSPTSPGPNTNTPPATATITLLMIHARGAWLRPGDTETVSANANWSDGASRPLTSVSWSTSNSGVARITPTNEAGLTAHLVAVAPGQATLTAVSGGVTQNVEVRVAAVTPPPPAGTSRTQAPVVINEFRLEGPGGAEDDFVELRNVSGATVDISGWAIAYSNAGGTVESLGSFPAGTAIGAGCHYLLMSANPKQGTAEPVLAADFLWSPSLANGGSLALHDGAGILQDQVGGGGRYGEGGRIGAQSFSGGGSFQRLRDSNNNAADFNVATTASRANRTAPCS